MIAVGQHVVCAAPDPGNGFAMSFYGTICERAEGKSAMGGVWLVMPFGRHIQIPVLDIFIEPMTEPACAQSSEAGSA